MNCFPIILSALLVLTCQETEAQRADTLFVRAAHTKLSNAKDYTLRVAELMPADKYAFRPAPDAMSFGEQLLHLSQNIGWLCSAYLTGKRSPLEKAKLQFHQKDSVLRVVIDVYDYALQTLDGLAPGELGDSVKFFAGPMTKLQIVNLINDHQTHHRAQLLVYLRLNGITPPRYVGW